MVDFLMIGPINTMCYINMHRLFIEDRVSVGYGVVTDYNNSNKKVLSYWYSSFSTEKDPIELRGCYDEKIHRKYLNFDAINIDNIREIPKDYNGVMGVPITFMRLYDRRQFEIVGFCDYDSDLLLWKEGDDIVKEMKKKYKDWRLFHPVIQVDGDVIMLYYRVFIRKRNNQNI